MEQSGKSSRETGSPGRPPLFLGASTHALDAKFRLFVPKRFQTELDPRGKGGAEVVLTAGQDRCLYLFDVDGFRRATDRLDTETFTGERERNVQRTFFANAGIQTLDSAGRILVPEHLRDIFGEERDVEIVGVMQRAEIWPRSEWLRVQAIGKQDIAVIDRVLCNDKERRA